MHPIVRNKRSLLLYLVGGIPFDLLFISGVSHSAHLPWTESAAVMTPVLLVLALLCLCSWYVCRALPLTSTPPWKTLSTNLIAGMVVSAAMLVLTRMVIVVYSGVLPGLADRFVPAVPLISVMVFLTYLLSAALHYALLAVESSRRAEILSREAELKALKAQVNPHFLFNSLNSISALTTTDPGKAREMCIRLSEFLRTSLRLGERTSIPLEEELALTRTYLDVEQVRFGQRLRITQSFDSECGACEVPPLVIQPLIENAIKHGIATLVEGGEISMTGACLPDAVRVTIENPFDPDSPETRRNGFGLVSVRNRLQARYGNAATCDVQMEHNLFRVILTLPHADKPRSIAG